MSFNSRHKSTGKSIPPYIYIGNILLIAGLLGQLLSCASKPINIVDELTGPLNAVVLIGTHNYHYINLAGVETSDPNSGFYFFGSGSNSISRDILAIPVTVGTKFKIVNFIGERGHVLSGDYDIGDKINWPSITINKPGIYYYGSITFTHPPGYVYRISYQDEPPPENTVDLAKKLYPKLFAKYQPVNF